MIERDYDYDEVKFFRSTHIKRARVAHICDHCHELIPVGTSYVREFWVMPGERPYMTLRHAPAGLGMCPKEIAQMQAEIEAEEARWAKWEQELDELY